MPKVNKLLPVIILFVLLTACNNYDFSNAFSYLPDSPKSGETITVLYNNQLTELKNAESITLTAYLYNIDIKQRY